MNSSLFTSVRRMLGRTTKSSLRRRTALYRNLALNPALETLESRALLSTVSITAPTNAPAEGGAPVNFVVSRDTADTTALTVKLGFSGKATNGKDYQKIAAIVTIPANQTSVNVPMTVIDDNKLEGPESAVITIKPSSAYSVSQTAASATVTIADNEKPTVWITTGKPVVSEAKPGKITYITFHRNGPTTEALPINAELSGAKEGTDFVNFPDLVIPKGSSKLKVPVQAVDNNTADGDRTLLVSLKGSSDYTGDPKKNSATITIQDNDFKIVGGYFPLTSTAQPRNFHIAAPGYKANATFTQTVSGSNVTMELFADSDNQVTYTFDTSSGDLKQTSWDERFDGELNSGTYSPAPTIAPGVMTMGKQYTSTGGDGSDGTVNVTSTLQKMETLRTALGKLPCLKINIVLNWNGDSWTKNENLTFWYNADHGLMKWTYKAIEHDAGHVFKTRFTATALS